MASVKYMYRQPNSGIGNIHNMVHRFTTGLCSAALTKTKTQQHTHTHNKEMSGAEVHSGDCRGGAAVHMQLLVCYGFLQAAV